MMSKPSANDLAAVAAERLLRRAFEDGAKWVAQVDDPARSKWSMDRGFAEFRESNHVPEAHCDCGIVSAPPLPTGETARWIMTCMGCGHFGTPMLPTETICGNCGSSDTAIWWSRPPLPVVAPERHTGAQRAYPILPLGCQPEDGQPLPPSPVDEAKSTFLRAYMDCLHGRADGITTVPLMDALIAAVRADERQQAEAEIEGLKLSGADRLRWYHEIEAKLTAAQQEIARLKGERDQLDCTRREGGDTRHCNLDRKCLRCLTEQRGSGVAAIAKAEGRQP